MDSKFEEMEVYIGKQKKKAPEGYVESCDLETGECVYVKQIDGLIERRDNIVNKQIKVETNNGIKRLLND